MQRNLFVITLAALAAAACVEPPSRQAPDPLPEPTVVSVAETHERIAAAVPESGVEPAGEGRFDVVQPQSPEPPGENPFILDDGTEMVANFHMDDHLAAHRVHGTLRAAGMEAGGSGGLGREGVYVDHRLAERARRLLIRIPGSVARARKPDGSFFVEREGPPPLAAGPQYEVVAQASGAADLPDVGELLSAAGIACVGVGEFSDMQWLAPRARAEDARRLLLVVPGARAGPVEDSLGPGALVIVPAANSPDTPARKFAEDDPFVNVAFHLDFDEIAGTRIWLALDLAGVHAFGVSNAGGASVSVPKSQFARARRILLATPGAATEPVEDPDRVGWFVVDGGAGEPVIRRAPFQPEVVVAWLAVHDIETWVRVATALEYGGFNARGGTRVETWFLSRAWITVPRAEAPAARRLLAALPGATKAAEGVVLGPGGLLVTGADDVAGASFGDFRIVAGCTQTDDVAWKRIVAAIDGADIVWMAMTPAPAHGLHPNKALLVAEGDVEGALNALRGAEGVREPNARGNASAGEFDLVDWR